MMTKLILIAVLLVSVSGAAFAQTPEAGAVAAVEAPTVPPIPAQDPAVPATPAAVAPLADGTMLAAVPPQQDAMIPQPTTPIEKEISEQLAFQTPNINVNAMASLFFTRWEHDLVLDARRGLTTRVPGTDDGIANAGPRDIKLSGIVYANAKDWTIWLNDLRVSPTAIPEEVLDLKVYKNYIELEWFDASTNQIFPIRLRAQQRFNLDTRMFLPG